MFCLAGMRNLMEGNSLCGKAECAMFDGRNVDAACVERLGFTSRLEELANSEPGPRGRRSTCGIVKANRDGGADGTHPYR